jgi:hypothetical protein
MTQPLVESVQTKEAVKVISMGFEIARMYCKIPDRETGSNHRVLVLEVSDCGDANFDLALAMFKHARAFGGLPTVD